MSYRALATRLEISSAAIGYCAESGEAIASENVYRLMERFFTNFPRTVKDVIKKDGS